jgi:hypothetical protein
MAAQRREHDRGVAGRCARVHPGAPRDQQFDHLRHAITRRGHQCGVSTRVDRIHVEPAIQQAPHRGRVAEPDRVEQIVERRVRASRQRQR